MGKRGATNVVDCERRTIANSDTFSAMIWCNFLQGFEIWSGVVSCTSI